MLKLFITKQLFSLTNTNLAFNLSSKTIFSIILRAPERSRDGCKGILVLAKAAPDNLRGNFQRICTSGRREAILREEIEVGRVLVEYHRMSAGSKKIYETLSTILSNAIIVLMSILISSYKNILRSQA